jgi:hypothetical protein
MKRTILLCVFLVSCLCGGALGAGQTVRKRGPRSIVGIVYFTNNSPKDYTFLVELFHARTKRRIAVKWTGEHGHFEFKDLKSGVYYLQISGDNICLLQYKLDASKQDPERLQVFGDAGCGHHHVEGLPAPRPIPRAQKR